MNNSRVTRTFSIWAVSAGLTLSVGGGTVTASEVHGAVMLKPHRAIYTMGLAATSGVGGPSLLHGAMLYEMTETCEAWKIVTKVILRSAQGEDPESESLRTIQTWESKDGLGFRFRVDEAAEGQPGPQLRGVAVIDAAGAPGVAEFVAPLSAQTELPKGSMFPTQHMAELIRHSRAGDTHFSRVVFDGASVDDPYEVSALIGAAPAPVLPEKVRGLLGSGARWTARLAYFALTKRVETPEYELSVVYRDDGIVESLRQDYDDHSIVSRLHQIEFLPRPTCTPVTGPLPDRGEGPT